MKREIEEIIKKAVLDLFKIKQANFNIDHPAVEKFGDYSTNVAMVLGKMLKKNPMEIADMINQQLTTYNLQQFEKIEVVAPGYINFYLSSEYLQSKVVEINKEQENFGKNDSGKDKKVLIEFISSNPTGPIHLGNGRGGPTGDTLANILEKSEYEAEREFYVNDFGNQVEVLGHSILKDEEAQYKGDYMDDLIERADKNLKDPVVIGNWAANEILEKFIKPTCGSLGINFNNWFSEKKLHDDGKVDGIVSLLKEKKLAYEKDGALWYKSTQFGDDKDRVIIKSDQKKTYIATDFAYHQDKIQRGFDKLINIQGADHHKEAETVKNFIENVLGKKNVIQTILTQFVRVLKNGEEVKMSKRKGVYFALDDLIEEVGKDAVRFIFISYAPTTHINFDINLAKERSEKNPVFYVQYAHARICSIIRRAQEEGIRNQESGIMDLKKLTHEKELSLIKELNKFPELVEEISESYEVHKLPHYAIKLADKFHSFYNDCRVIDEENPELTVARLNLINAVRIVLAETLRLMGITAPESM